MSFSETVDLVRWLGKRIMFGREGPASAVQDFEFDPGEFRLLVRKLLINDVGDPGDMGFGRIGPDNAAWDTPRGLFRRLRPGVNIGTWYWRAWCGLTDDDPGVGFTGKNGQIYARTVGEQTPTSSGGSLHFGTTVPGQTEPVDRLVIEADGTLSFPGVPTRYDADGNAYLLVRAGNGKLYRMQLT